ncbi:threonine/serine ThrE exporter family protein [Solirubrobacter soli]|uniref:threonine/serine ThrE exporter family protein n=1 Tax=Solirubrobacter soli TaxID=363832 RepID=UPI000486B958|nr:threonine/serine exporter family protein [Solirubrobacter soli]
MAVTRSEPAVQFIVELASALNEAGESVTLNQRRMDRIAAAYDAGDAQVAVMPNMVLAAGRHGAAVLAHGAASGDPIQRLDRAGAIEDVAKLAERGAIDPDDGLRRLDEIAVMRHRFGATGVIVGHAVLTVGLALILQPTPVALGMAAVFGAFVGALKLYARHTQTIGVLLPVAAATLVSALAFWFAPDRTIDASMRVLIPPLVTFLPGSLLTTATLDLAAGEVISGSSRLVAGTMQLVLLTFGIAAGATIAGVSLDEAITNEAKNTLGDWAPWLGVVVFGVGCFVHFSGPPRALGWLLLVLFSAYAGQQLGGRLVSETLGGFFGALIVTPVAAWVATRPTGPPALATFLPAFWILVPGAVSLIGIAEFVGTGRESGLDHFFNALDVFIAISVGVLVGNALVLRYTARSVRKAH